MSKKLIDSFEKNTLIVSFIYIDCSIYLHLIWVVKHNVDKIFEIVINVVQIP